MDDNRIFWLCLGWFGLTQLGRWAYAAIRVGVWPGNAVALGAGLILVGGAVYGLTRPEAAGGPETRTLTWWAAVAAAVLGTVGLFF